MARYDKDIADGLVHGTTLLSGLGGGALDGIDDQSSSNDDQITIKDTEVVINEDGDDLDFRVESADESHIIFVEGATNRVSIGDNTGSPGATLEVTLTEALTIDSRDYGGTNTYSIYTKQPAFCPFTLPK